MNKINFFKIFFKFLEKFGVKNGGSLFKLGEKIFFQEIIKKTAQEPGDLKRIFPLQCLKKSKNFKKKWESKIFIQFF